MKSYVVELDSRIGNNRNIWKSEDANMVAGINNEFVNGMWKNDNSKSILIFRDFLFALLFVFDERQCSIERETYTGKSIC